MNGKQWSENFYSNYFPNLTPNCDGECAVRCPWHDDNTASMSVNLFNGRFRCHVCDLGGDEYEFYKIQEEKENLSFGKLKREIWDKFGERPKQEPVETPPEGVFIEPDKGVIEESIVEDFHQRLLNRNTKMDYMLETRGITEETLRRFKIGWDSDRFTIPIYDTMGHCVNIRRYLPEAPNKQPKMISYKTGMGTARPFPIKNIRESDTILIVEGEMDCLLMNQLGYNAITTTGGAETWKANWNSLFKDKSVLICYDVDRAGINGAAKVSKNILGIAKEVRIISLPILDPPDADLTDYFINMGQSKEDFDLLVENTLPIPPEQDNKQADPCDPIKVHLSQADNPRYIGKQICTDVMVVGKNLGAFGYPKKMEFNCARDNDKTCEACSMAMKNGLQLLEFKDDNRNILKLIDCTDKQQMDIIKSEFGIHSKCHSFELEVIENGSVEILRLQPELDSADENTVHKNLDVYYLGHGLKANLSYHVRGTTVTHPVGQEITILVSEAIPSQDNVSSFMMTDELHEALKTFQPAEGQTVHEKFDHIQEDLMNNVTHMYGREDVIGAVDMVYHSVGSFNFQKEHVMRGWVEALVIGDTRTGKSETAQTLANHYKMGEFITGENTTFAGLIGGAQQIKNQWFISWGKIPLNDKRLIVIDEASGLSQNAIGDMSGVRSSGVAQIVKIETEKTHARTRLIWISNPREGDSLENYSYGVQAVSRLIGKNEDVARFEFVVSCATKEVDPMLIHRMEEDIEHVPHVYTSDLCRQLILWVWSRGTEDVVFTDASVRLVMKLSMEMARDYVSSMPLVEGANQRIKLARIAVAVACRVYSTDDGYNVVVEPEHVQYAHDFLQQVYRKQSLGYWNMSKQIRRQEQLAEEARPLVLRFLQQNQDVARAFRDSNEMNPSRLENFCDISKEEVKSTIKFLSSKGMIEDSHNGYKKKAIFNSMLQEGIWETEGQNMDDLDTLS